LVDERERACDEAVLASGVAAKTYAAGIVNVCDAYMTSPLRCAAGVGGSVLEVRVARILAHCRPRPIARFIKSALVALPAATLALPFALGVANAPTVVAQPAELGRFAQSSRIDLWPLFFN